MPINTFTGSNSFWCLKPAHRQGVLFLPQDVRQEALRGRFDLVLCRNLAFTYFAPALQERVLERIAASLEPRGVLVIGGSLASLLASRVLVDVFDEVIVVERDRLPKGPEARDGLPQGRHVHVLLVRGLTTFEQLFPGIHGELAAAGAEILDSAQDLAWHTAAGWGLRFHSHLPLLSCGRFFLDFLIRRRIGSFPGIRRVDRSEVSGLSLSEDKRRVIGVSWRRRGTAGSQTPENVWAADLVVDIGDRTSQFSRFLASHGYAPPMDTVVDALLGYATRIYRRSGSPLPAGRASICKPHRRSPRVAASFCPSKATAGSWG